MILAVFLGFILILLVVRLVTGFGSQLTSDTYALDLTNVTTQPIDITVTNNNSWYQNREELSELDKNENENENTFTHIYKDKQRPSGSNLDPTSQLNSIPVWPAPPGYDLDPTHPAPRLNRYTPQALI